MPASAEPRSPLARLAGGLLRRAADVLVPPACFACSEPVAEQGLLCPSCFPRLRRIGPPHCRCCGLPFGHSAEAVEAGLCASCLEYPPSFERARAAWVYDEASKPLLLAFKYGDRTELAPAFARAMASAGAALLAEADVIAPVTLHRLRLISRRYNQAALLAHALGSITGKPVAPALLRRTRRTAPLAGRLGGARVLLIDDVLTSGATANACSEALLAAGASAVDVLTVARTPAPKPDEALDAADTAGDVPGNG
jgi:predicted amidophosphoribosyltransferase